MKYVVVDGVVGTMPIRYRSGLAGGQSGSLFPSVPARGALSRLAGTLSDGCERLVGHPTSAVTNAAGGGVIAGAGNDGADTTSVGGTNEAVGGGVFTVASGTYSIAAGRAVEAAKDRSSVRLGGPPLSIRTRIEIRPRFDRSTVARCAHSKPTIGQVVDPVTICRFRETAGGPGLE